METGTAEPHQKIKRAREAGTHSRLLAERRKCLQKRITVPRTEKMSTVGGGVGSGNMEDSPGLTTSGFSGKVGAESRRKEVTSASLQRHSNLCKMVEMKH